MTSPSKIRSLFNRLAGKDKQPILIVSGLPRSGTSMMMKMLEAGGLPPLTDEIRVADGDNPKGYYEFEPVKALRKGDFSWLPEAQGKVVKVIATLLPYLPDTYTYRVIFIHREMREILASQKKMLLNRGEDPDKVSDDEMARIYEKHLKQVDVWMRTQPNLQRIEVSYNQMIQNPTPEIERINQFLGGILDTQKMSQAIDVSLYRQRSEKSPSRS